MLSHNQIHSKLAQGDTMALAQSPHVSWRLIASPPHRDVTPHHRRDAPPHCGELTLL